MRKHSRSRAHVRSVHFFQRLLELGVNDQINPVRVEVNVVWSNPSHHLRALLAHAADILRKRDAFVAAVSQFLKEEAEKIRSPRSYRDEIEGLKIDRVCLFWPERPDDGMISFSGGRDYRLWRCDYVARQPKGLGFDS